MDRRAQIRGRNEQIIAEYLTIVAMIASFFFLAQALKTIPVGTGYTVWTGIGAAGTAILGIVLFSESAALPRLLCIALIVAASLG